MEVCAHKLAPPALPQSMESTLCKEYLKGYCRNGDSCAQSHEITRVFGQGLNSNATEGVSATPNVLRLGPRLLPDGDSIFEHDGPGHLSTKGPRHDNDLSDIRKIRVLPTMDEILSLRRPYMPYKDFHLPHFLPAGQTRLIDTLFRQLRYESTERIIDACYHASQLLWQSNGKRLATPDPRQDTPNGTRYHLFWDVAFEQLIFDEKKGLVVRVSFACPGFLQGRKIHSSGLLENGMMVALVALDKSDSRLSVAFFETHIRESTDSMKSRGGAGLRG